MTGHVYKAIVDLGKPNDDMIWNTLASVGDSKAHRVCVKTVLNGQIIDTAKLRAMLCVERQDTATRYIDAAFDSEGYAVAELDKSCYEVEGRLKCTMQIADGDETIVSVARIYLMVTKANGEIIIDPSHTLPSVRELLAEVANMRAATKETVATNTAVKTAENQRVQNENARIAAEKNRATAEDQRVKNESARVTAEKDRASAESRRSQSEDARTTAEKNRSTAEESRNKAEKERASAEQIRVNAEKNRLETDKKLSENEENRAHSFEQYGGDICQLKKELKNVSAHQNVLIGNESGNPISTSDAFAAPLCGLHIYGRSRQDGTPSADNTVEIVGAGADGTLQVKITGANLLDFEKAASENANAEFTFENGILAVKALNKQGWAGIFIPLPDECAGKQIFFRRTIDSNPNELRSLIQMRYSLNGNTVYFSNMSTIKIPEGASDIRYNVMARNENTAAEGTITVQYPVVCYGSALLPYEPYHEQVITVQTSGGLHGIPVSSGGNFVDENGQRWVCDEIDFTQGKRIKRVNVEALDATKTLSEQSGFEMEPVEFPLSSEEIAAYKALTAHAQTTVVQAKNVAGIRLDYQRDVNLVIQSLENAIASMTTSN